MRRHPAGGIVEENKEIVAQEEVSHFEVKGKPKIGLGPEKINGGSNLSTLLKQKIEEFKERQKKEARPVTAHPGAEFKPENVPYIPDSTHPLLDKHNLATPERNAGFQDASMVPPMYRQPLNKMDPPKAAVSMQVGVPKPGTNSETKPEPEKAQDKEFELKVPRSDMHKGGHYMPNESRPYRPGDTK
jgi:hypothetical protein